MDLPQLHIGGLVARLPIVQGGMAVGISLSGLASAVAREGGVGVIATAMIGQGETDRFQDPDGADTRALEREIRTAREASAGSEGLIGVNIMCALTNFAELVRTSLRSRADVIFAGAGLPLDLPEHVRRVSEELQTEARTRLAPIVSSARAASILCRKWASRFDVFPDALVVEGPRAGGHLGFKPEQIDDPEFALEKIVPEVLETLKPHEDSAGRAIPVIAAGGVYTGGDIARYLDMGAAAAQLGTRFVATHECDADERFKRAYIEAREEDIAIINSPVGMPGRAIMNSFLEAVSSGLRHPKNCIHRCLSGCEEEASPYCIAQALVNACHGRLRHGFAFAGANAHLVDRIVSVKELMATLREEILAFQARAEHARALRG